MSRLWGYEEMKNPDAKVNIGVVEANAVFIGEGCTHLYIKNNQN